MTRASIKAYWSLQLRAWRVLFNRRRDGVRL